MILPCHECPVLAICLMKFKGKTIKCDIVWDFIVTDTKHEYIGCKIIPGPIRSKRVEDAKALFHNLDFTPEDERDLL